MLKFLVILLLLFSCPLWSQKKPVYKFDENGNELVGQFVILKDGYIFGEVESDTAIIRVAQKRLVTGTLSGSQLHDLRTYLMKITASEIDPAKNIVINYLSSIPKVDDAEGKSKWTLLEFPNRISRQLKTWYNAEHFWINSPGATNLEYYHQGKINWISDSKRMLNKLFFPYEVPYGHFVLIKPDGSFLYLLGEHNKADFKRYADEFFLDVQ